MKAKIEGVANLPQRDLSRAGFLEHLLRWTKQ
jgi:hypothetical protein